MTTPHPPFLAHRAAAFVLAAATLGAVSLASPGASADPSMECAIGASSQLEIGACVSATEERVNAALDQAHGFAIDAARRIDEQTGRDASEPALIQAQRAWQTYRDRHCDFVGSTFGGGTGTGIAITSCRIDLARARIHVLLNYAQ